LEWQSDPDGALEIFKQILHQDESSDVAARSAMFLAVMYDRHFAQADSAIYYYDWLQSHKPESEQALATINRYEELQQMISMINKVDTKDVPDNSAEIIAVPEDSVEVDNQEAVEDTTIEN
jgi:hypothetical protein